PHRPLEVFLADARVGEVLFLGEVERELPRGRSGRIGGVEEVRRDRETQVPADGPRGGGLRVGGAREEADDGDRRAPFDGERDHGPRRDVLDETRVERLALVFGVVALRELRGHPEHLRGDDLEAFPLEAADYLPDHASAHSVRLHESERPLDRPFGHRPAEPDRGLRFRARAPPAPLGSLRVRGRAEEPYVTRPGRRTLRPTGTGRTGPATG